MAAPRYTLQLPAELAQSFSLPRLLAAETGLSAKRAYELLEQFELSGPERRFARSLLRAKTNLWLFRCNQTCFCGDFVVVDMSGGPARRRVFVLELKAGEEVRPGGGVQLRNFREAVREIATRDGIVEPESEALLLRGGEDEVLRHLGVDAP